MLPRSVDRVLVCVTSVCKKDVSVLPRSVERMLYVFTWDDCRQGIVCVTSVCTQSVSVCYLGL